MRAPVFIANSETRAWTCKQVEVFVGPHDINSISDSRLREYALQCMANRESCAQLVACVPAAFLERLATVIWQLSLEQRASWSKQRALAKVVACASGCRSPPWAEAESPGQWMHQYIMRYRDNHKKALHAERMSKMRAEKAGKAENSQRLDSHRVALEEEIYHCKFGCTPAVLPKRKTPPGLLPRKVEHITCSLAEENARLLKENINLQRLETSAVEQLSCKLQSTKSDLQCSVASEHVALLSCDKRSAELESCRSEASVRAAELERKRKAVNDENQWLQKEVKQKGKILALEGKVTSSWQELENERRKREKEKRELERDMEVSLAMREQLHDEEKAKSEKWKSMCKYQEEVMKGWEAQHIKQGSFITQLHLQLAEKEKQHQREMLLLRKEKERVEADYEQCTQNLARARELKNAMAQKRRLADKRAATSEGRLERAKAAESEVHSLQFELDELHEALEFAGRANTDAVREQLCMAPAENATFKAYEWRYRVLIYKTLLRRTPPSAIGPNLVDAAAYFAPGKQVRVPEISFLRRMRQEATLVGEAISAFRIASCKRVVSFGFDETTKMGDGLASASFQIETSDGIVCDEVLRAAFLIPGGCADQVARAMETNLFARGRKLLCRWQEIYEKKNGLNSWQGPKASQLGLHRLTHALLMSDTCNGAQAAKHKIAELVAAEVEKELRQSGRWDVMSSTEREEATTCFFGDCMQHIRNILLDAMASSAASMLEDELRESLEAFSAYERMSTDPMQLIRAAYKEFHHEGEYAKGKGKEFEHWRHTKHPSTFFLGFERARGGRQDLAFNGAAPLYANRVLACHFLREQVFTPGHSNVLEDFLWGTLSCMEMVALTRVLTLWDLVFSVPFRWLCGCSSRLSDWSIYDFGPVLDSVEKLLEKVAADGEELLSPDLAPFAAVADKQPLFKAWMDELQHEEVRMPDKESKYKWHVVLLAEARDPQNESNREATDMTIQLAMVMARAGLQKMHDPRAAIKDWLSSTNGKHSARNVTAAAFIAARGAHSTNDRVEGNFGGYDAVIRMFRTISMDAASGIAHHMRIRVR